MNALSLAPSRLPVLRWLCVAAWCAVPVVLALPLVAMQLTDEVRWTLSDFVFAGVLICGCGGLLELALRRAPNLAYFLGSLLAVGVGFLQVWANAAVGIVGSESNPHNLLFFGVVALALAGALLSAGKARRLVWVMGTAAAAQLLVALWLRGAEPLLLPFTAVCLAAWLGAAALFHVADRSLRR